MKRLPLDTDIFEEIADPKLNYLYVDKTERILDLVNGGKVFFLSRPRRFGKSLLINTLKELFEGREELFKGLYIYNKWDWNTMYPVIKLDISGTDVRSVESLEGDLTDILETIAHRDAIDLGQVSLARKFAKLIENLHEKRGQKVVILIDEYDEAIRDNLDKPHELQIAVKESLKSFFEVIKNAGAHIHFVLITGVSKFSSVSIFSGLNNLVDITLDPKYCDICGYTQKELEHYFGGYIDQVAKQYKEPQAVILESIKQWYNGYTWDGETAIYNPYSVLFLFRTSLFDNYWFASATPTFLANMIKKDSSYKKFTFEKKDISKLALLNVTAEMLSPEAALFQTGYLTIAAIKADINNELICTLVWPNKEVRQSFSAILRQIMIENS